MVSLDEDVKMDDLEVDEVEQAVDATIPDTKLKFKPLFVKSSSSLYRQCSSYRITCGEDLTEDRIPEENPCHEGFHFAGIEISGGNFNGMIIFVTIIFLLGEPSINVICNLEDDGEIVYKTPSKGLKTPL